MMNLIQLSLESCPPCARMRKIIESNRDKSFIYRYMDLKDLSVNDMKLLKNLNVDVSKVKRVPYVVVHKDYKVIYEGLPSKSMINGNLSKLEKNEI